MTDSPTPSITNVHLARFSPGYDTLKDEFARFANSRASGEFSRITQHITAGRGIRSEGADYASVFRVLKDALYQQGVTSISAEYPHLLNSHDYMTTANFVQSCENATTPNAPLQAFDKESVLHFASTFDRIIRHFNDLFYSESPVHQAGNTVVSLPRKDKETPSITPCPNTSLPAVDRAVFLQRLEHIRAQFTPLLEIAQRMQRAERMGHQEHSPHEAHHQGIVHLAAFRGGRGDS